MTGRRSTMRKVGKWVGLVTCLLILGGTAVTWGRGRRLSIKRARCDIVVGRGGAACYWWTERTQVMLLLDESLAVEARIEVFEREMAGEYEWTRCWPGFEWDWWGGQVVIPFWLLLLLAAFPTSSMWRHDRRRIPSSRCGKCGRNLTGNSSGVCPECATPAPADRRRGMARGEIVLPAVCAELQQARRRGGVRGTLKRAGLVGCLVIAAVGASTTTLLPRPLTNAYVA
jgi:hypothetical protein